MMSNQKPSRIPREYARFADQRVSGKEHVRRGKNTGLAVGIMASWSCLFWSNVWRFDPLMCCVNFYFGVHILYLALNRGRLEWVCTLASTSVLITLLGMTLDMMDTFRWTGGRFQYIIAEGLLVASFQLTTIFPGVLVAWWVARKARFAWFGGFIAPVILVLLNVFLNGLFLLIPYSRVEF